MPKKIHFIINPAAGQPYPVLHTINSVCGRLRCAWSISVTNRNNVVHLVQEAARSDIDVIAVCGGDGTISEVAGAMLKTDKVLGILPGGTANILSVELGIPQDIRKACELICADDNNTRNIDAGRVNGKHFFLRLGFGFEAEIVKRADRSFKNQVGRLAYAFSGFQALLKTRPTRYHLVLDGEERTCEGLSLVVANSGNLGLPGVSILPKIDVSDGLLDVIMISPAGLRKLFSMEGRKVEDNAVYGLFQHWQVKEISVRPDPPQFIHCDGETFQDETAAISVMPSAVKILCKQVMKRWQTVSLDSA